MPTRTGKPRKPRTTEPQKADPATDEQILGEFHRHAQTALAGFEEAKAGFLDKCAADPSEALKWRGEYLVRSQAEAQMWTRATRFVESSQCPLSMLGLVSELRDYAQEEMDGIVRSCPWEHNSTSAMANLVKSERLSGEAHAWHAIRAFARWAVDEIGKREG